MRPTHQKIGFILVTLIATSVAVPAFAQCNHGSGSQATGSTGSFAPRQSSGSYPIVSNYSLGSPLSYQQSVYRQLAYQQQANYQLKAKSEARLQAAKDPNSDYNTNRAEKAFELAEKAEKAGKLTAAKGYFKRVVEMVEGTALAQSADEAIQRLTEPDTTQLVASNERSTR